MLKILRIGFILALLIGFLASCKHRKEEQAVLKSASQPSRKKSASVKHKPAPVKTEWKNKLQETLGLSDREMQSRLYSFVAEWYGVPYRYGGCQKSGVDCSCFANILCQKVYGQELPRQSNDIFKSCRQLSLSDAREGDLLFFKIGSTRITHVAVYLRRKYFVHASTSRGVMVSSLNEAYYKKYFFCAGRLKEG